MKILIAKHEYPRKVDIAWVSGRRVCLEEVHTGTHALKGRLYKYWDKPIGQCVACRSPLISKYPAFNQRCVG